jgi:DNA-binding transcriptional LysR family regulator
MPAVCAAANHPAIAEPGKAAIQFRMASQLPDNFDWALVKSFLAVLDAGSLSRAARRIGAQQPTLSRHVAELETQLATPLFERTGRGLTPTAAALAIADAARQMQDAALAVSRGLARSRDAATGTVRITTSTVAAVWLLPAVLAALQREEPGLQVELVASNALDNLLRRDADIAVRMVRPQQGSLIARKLGDIRIVAAAHRDYLARAGTPRDAAELLSNHRLIGYDRDDLVIRGFAAAGVALSREHFVLRTDDQVAYGRLVAEGAGIGFVAAYNLAYWPGVVALLPQLVIPPLPCWLAVHREIRGNRLVRRVYDFLAEAVPAELRRLAS